MDQKKRGSDALLEGYRAGGFKIGDQLIERVADAVGDTELHECFVKGLPAVDYLKATFAPGPADSTGQLVAKLLTAIEVQLVPVTVQVFPRGIPWPDQYLVNLTIAHDGP